MGKPTYDAEKLLKELEVYEEIKEKWDEESIDNLTFWDLKEDFFEKNLEIKAVGKRKRIIRRMEEVLDEHKKEFEEKEKQKDKAKYKKMIEL